MIDKLMLWYMKTKIIIVTLLSIILVDMVGLYLYHYHSIIEWFVLHRFGPTQDGVKNLR